MAIDIFTYLRQLGYIGTTAQMLETLRRDTTKHWNSDVPVDLNTYDVGVELARIKTEADSAKGILTVDVVGDYGATGAFSGNDTTAIQNAVDAVGAAGGGRVYFRPDSWFNTNGIALKSNVSLIGGGSSTTIAHRAGATDDLIYLAAGTETFVSIKDMNINGNSANQTNAVNGINLDNSAGSGLTLANHNVDKVYIYNVKGNGLILGAHSRATKISDVGIYKADGYGLVLAGADSIVSNVDVGQSGLCGVWVTGGAYQISTIKSWYSGRIDPANGDGFLIAVGDTVITNGYAQDSKGNGFHLFKAGTTLQGITLENCVSDNSNSAVASYSGFSLYNIQNSRIRGSIRVNAGGDGGVPVNAVSQAGGCLANDIDVAAPSGAMASWFAAGGDIGTGYINTNGRQGRVYTSPFTATLGVNPWNAETTMMTLTGDTVVTNPGITPAGLKLRFILTQDVSGGHAISFDTNFSVSFTPSTTANAVNVVDFISNGTKWIQTSYSII